MRSHRYDDGGSKHLWNVGKLLPDYTRSNPEDSHIQCLYIVKYNLRRGPFKDWKVGFVEKLPNDKVSAKSKINQIVHRIRGAVSISFPKQFEHPSIVTIIIALMKAVIIVKGVSSCFCHPVGLLIVLEMVCSNIQNHKKYHTNCEQLYGLIRIDKFYFNREILILHHVFARNSNLYG
jgi:hypothetical protein